MLNGRLFYSYKFNNMPGLLWSDIFHWRHISETPRMLVSPELHRLVKEHVRVVVRFIDMVNQRRSLRGSI